MSDDEPRPEHFPLNGLRTGATRITRLSDLRAGDLLVFVYLAGGYAMDAKVPVFEYQGNGTCRAVVSGDEGTIDLNVFEMWKLRPGGGPHQTTTEGKP